MKFSGKMCFMIIIKVAKSHEIFRKDVPYANIKSLKNQGFTFSLEDPLFQRPLEYGEEGSNYPPPPPSFPAVLGLRNGHTIALRFPGFSLFPFFFIRCVLFYYCSHFLSQLSHQ